jgi:hypothetical protein
VNPAFSLLFLLQNRTGNVKEFIALGNITDAGKDQWLVTKIINQIIHLQKAMDETKNYNNGTSKKW